MLLPPLKFIDLDKIFTEDTSHYEVPPCKISSKSKHFKYPKLSSKIKKWKKMTWKSSFGRRHCHVMAGTYEPRAKITFRDCCWCPKKISWPWEHFLGCQITIFWRPLNRKLQNLEILGLFASRNFAWRYSIMWSISSNNFVQIGELEGG